MKNVHFSREKKEKKRILERYFIRNSALNLWLFCWFLNKSTDRNAVWHSLVKKNTTEFRNSRNTWLKSRSWKLMISTDLNYYICIQFRVTADVYKLPLCRDSFNARSRETNILQRKSLTFFDESVYSVFYSQHFFIIF